MVKFPLLWNLMVRYRVNTELLPEPVQSNSQLHNLST